MKDILRILLVDDDADDRDLFTEAVMEVDRSIKCYTARDGLDALSFLEQTEELPHFIFVDLNMPRMNGRELLKKLKETTSYKDVPVIIYTTSTTSQDIDESITLGADSYMVKPVVFLELCNEITRVVTAEPRRTAAAY